MLRDEPSGYARAYATALGLCAESGGATKAAIEHALEGDPALSMPKRVYASYFISKLETVGGLAWDGSWKTTKPGRQMLGRDRVGHCPFMLAPRARASHSR